jgi:invasion protein IalB
MIAIRSCHINLLPACVAAMFLAQPAAAQQPPRAQAQAPGGGQPSLLGQYGDWGAYTATPGGRKVCFALAKPTSSQTNPPNRPRDPAYVFVSSRPSEKVKDEVSVIIGYPFKANTDATVEIGSAAFAMYTQGDGAWIKNAAEETRMVEAMRKGADMVVRGESGRGTKTTDTFSLKGLAQALDRVGQECK